MRGAVHLFAIDSDGSEPDGNLADSKQAAWLRDKLASSTARWQVVYMHHPPYSSASHGSTVELQWPYQPGAPSSSWRGMTTATSGPTDGITYIVNGLGGAENYPIGTPVPAAASNYTGGFGALLVDADATAMRLRFYKVGGQLSTTSSIRRRRCSARRPGSGAGCSSDRS